MKIHGEYHVIDEYLSARFDQTLRDKFYVLKIFNPQSAKEYRIGAKEGNGFNIISPDLTERELAIFMNGMNCLAFHESINKNLDNENEKT